MTKVVAIIPARMGSTRFPGKPLVFILGRPMIEHIYRRVALCSLIDSVIVATPDDEIRINIEGIGGKVVMTSPSHVRATDRVAEAARELGCDIVVMVQGDEPMITPEMIAQSVNSIVSDPVIDCVNLIQRIKTRNEFLDPNTIKVVRDTSGNALYFSRSPIPSIDFDHASGLPVFKQVCVIPFRAAFLQTFAAMPPTHLEAAESIDMLRILEHGYNVRLVETPTVTHAVDTPDDLILVEKLMRIDPMTKHYMEASI